jgi:thiol-disulfide isomerase/thioredoxin
MRFISILLLAALCDAAQSSAPPATPSPEEQELEQELKEAGSSPMEYARAIERHLKKYPNSPQKAEMQRVLAQAAVDMKDRRRILEYGVPVVEAGSRNPQVLDPVIRALLDKGGKEDAERALKYAGTLTEVLTEQRKVLLERASPGDGTGRRIVEAEYGLARSYLFQARALAQLGKYTEAVEAANKGWEADPTEDNARERSDWLERAGKPREALAAFAQAVAIGEDRTGGGDPAKDRQRLAALFKQSEGLEQQFGGMLLEAYAQVSVLQAAQEKRIKEFDPNFGARQPMQFTLTSLQDGKLEMSSLLGKVVVLDFWATWCGPCRVQHPMYEQVKQKFKNKKDVVFLAVNTDEDRAAVQPFLESHKWSKQVYFDDGLSSFFRVSSIPTTVVLNRQGGVASRMNGFIPDRFVEMLTARIDEALQEN